MLLILRFIFAPREFVFWCNELVYKKWEPAHELVPNFWKNLVAWPKLEWASRGWVRRLRPLRR